MQESPYATLRAVVAIVLLAAAPLLAMGAVAAAKALTPRTATAVAAHTAPAIVVGVGGRFSGLGFEACSAPSVGQMAAWSASPYRAVGIYVGGINRSCAQPNLTASWVQAELSAGWALVPTYVGPQAPGNQCGCWSIAPSQAASEGAAAASDAVSRLQALGIGAGSPVYYDMEAYAAGGTASRAVLAFLGAWTAKLHAAGYLSGVYSSVDAGVSDLASRRGTAYPEPDEIWFAHWNGLRTTGDSGVPAADWAGQRLHQFAGERVETWGGVTLKVDDDSVDASVVVAGSRARPAGGRQVPSRSGATPQVPTERRAPAARGAHAPAPCRVLSGTCRGG